MPAEQPALAAQLVAELQRHTDLTGLVEIVVAHAEQLVPDAEHASLVVRRRESFETLAASSPLARQADALQFEMGRGPCVETAVDVEWHRVGDVARDPRWTSWGSRAAALGVRSLLSTALESRGERVGALNLYSTHIGGFGDPGTREIARLYASQVAYAVSATRKIADLEVAMDSRHVIGMAQGVLMERFSVDIDQAFAILQRASSLRNRKLRDVAYDLVSTGRIDGLGLPGLVAEA